MAKIRLKKVDFTTDAALYLICKITGLVDEFRKKTIKIFYLLK